MSNKIYDSIPVGFYPLKNTNTAPKGTKWYWNKQSLFGGKFKAILVRNEVLNVEND